MRARPGRALRFPAGSASEKARAHGGAAVTGVEVQRDDRGNGRSTAHVKAGAGLEAAIRADARAIAQEEARAQLRRQEKVRAGINARGREAAALLEVFRAAWKTGGSARANALFEFCFGGERNQRVSQEVLALLASLEQRAALHERFRGHGYAFGHFKTRTQGSGHVKVEGEVHGGKPEGEHHGGKPGGEHGEKPGDENQGTKPEETVTTQPQSGGNTNGQVPTTGETPSLETPLTAPTEEAAPEGQVAPAEQENAPQGSPEFVAFAQDTSNGTDTSSGQTVQTASNGQLASTGRDLPLLLALGSGALAGGLLLRRRFGGAR